ncbi:MAG: flagellar basal body P-ring formation chaperone FlgA [Porticoccaceae bacterium]|nr:flagellar basal body P-ring formation chaperone FlgA [Porticoccaceae bacterium]
MPRRYLPLLILLWSSTFASAADQQTPQSIRSAVKDFLLKQPQIQRFSDATVQPGRLDKRLKLERCNTPLQVFLPPGGKLIGKSTVGVRCTGSSPWTIYVPVTVTAYAAVATANHPLQRGALLIAEDFSMVQQSLHQVPAGYLDNRQELIGKQLTRTVAAGKTLTRNMLKSPTLVKRGQQVTLIAQQRNFEVRMSGKALANGAAGDRIRVENLSSRKIVEGTIDAQGAVVVD